MKIVCCVSHFGAPEIWASLKTVASLGGPHLDRVRVVIGKASQEVALSASLAIARAANADLLLHLRSDVLLSPMALEQLLVALDRTPSPMVAGSCYDPLVDRAALGHVHLIDLRQIDSTLDWADIQRGRPSLPRCATPFIDTGDQAELGSGVGGDLVGYWHPVWTARDLYLQFAIHLESNRRSGMTEFLERGLALNPKNRALQAGQAALLSGTARTFGAANLAFERYAAVHQSGSAYYVKHQLYEALAKQVLNTHAKCICEPADRHVPLVDWR